MANFRDSVTSAVHFTYRIPTFTPSGPGFAWASECLKPWKGRGDESTFVKRITDAGKAVFKLRVGGVYLVSAPKKTADGYAADRHHYLVEQDGQLAKLTKAQAEDLLVRKASFDDEDSSSEEQESARRSFAELGTKKFEGWVQ